MKNIIKPLLVVLVISFAQMAFAEWTYHKNTFPEKWIVTNGKTSIQYNKEKSAKAAAKALNKAEKKKKKKKGVINDGSEDCLNPIINC